MVAAQSCPGFVPVCVLVCFSVCVCEHIRVHLFLRVCVYVCVCVCPVPSHQERTDNHRDLSPPAISEGGQDLIQVHPSIPHTPICLPSLLTVIWVEGGLESEGWREKRVKETEWKDVDSTQCEIGFEHDFRLCAKCPRVLTHTHTHTHTRVNTHTHTRSIIT